MDSFVGADGELRFPIKAQESTNPLRQCCIRGCAVVMVSSFIVVVACYLLLLLAMSL